MKTRFWTLSGSEYLIDYDEKVWHRGDNPESRNVRTSNGTYRSVSAIEVGRSVVLICPPLVEGAVFRRIRTSAVVRVSVASDSRAGDETLVNQGDDEGSQ